MDRRQARRGRQVGWAVGVALLVAVACSDDVGVVLEPGPPGECDSLICPPPEPPETVTVVLTDTLFCHKAWHEGRRQTVCADSLPRHWPAP